MAATDGDDLVLATAQQIVRALGTNDMIADDMLRILSNFDGRFSSISEKLRRNRETFLPVSPSVKLSKEQARLQFAGDIVMKWDITSSEVSSKPMLWDCHRKEAVSYLHAVEELQHLVSSLSVSQLDRPAFHRVQNLLQLAMARLEEEFRHLLVKHSDPVDPEWIFQSVLGPSFRSNGVEDETDLMSCSSGDEDGDEDIPVAQPVTDLKFTIDLLHAEVISDLHDIARIMIAVGCGRECCQLYASVRKAVLAQSLLKLGVEKLSIEDVQKIMWEDLEERTKKWNQAIKIAVRVLYASERILCEQVFAGLSPWGKISFAELAKGPAVQLLSFGEGIAISRRSPEKLFKILDMYETLSDLLPDINSIFSDELCSNVRSDAKGVLVRLGQAARGIFAEFENAIQRDASKTPVPGGSVHPLTRYVMNYIWLLFCYAGTLKRLLGDKKEAACEFVSSEGSGSLELVLDEECNNGADHLPPLAVQIIWLTVLLECNLDAKSKLYKDVAQTYLFLMNNVHYIVQKVKQSELASFVGDDWVKKHTSQVRQYATNYVRVAWKKVLACLRDDGLRASGTFSGVISKVTSRNRLKEFNCAFEELHRIQSSWIVPDPQLREELRLSITEKLIPAYRSFSCRYLESGRHPERYIKYTPEDLETCLLDLFEGISPVGMRKSFSSSGNLTISGGIGL